MSGNEYQDTVTANGYIAVVQEERFRLVTDDGRGLLLTLASDAHADPRDLRSWAATHAHVQVRYTGSPDLTSGVAHAVKRA